jgi:hypothetical protein
MIGTVLIVVTPWIAFGLSLATVCLRLRRFRRFARRPRNRESHTASDHDNGSSADTSGPAGNAHHRASVSSSEADRSSLVRSVLPVGEHGRVPRPHPRCAGYVP